MTETADGDAGPGGPEHDNAGDAAAGDGVPQGATDVPPTRRHATAEFVRAAGPPAPAPAAFPDDGALARGLRKADHALGLGEQAVLFALLAAVVVTAAGAALSDRVIGVRLGRWWFDVVRGGTFSIAMIGAVFASHQQRHLAMDLISRRLPPRGRLALRVGLALFTVFVAALLVRSGLHQLDSVGGEAGEHLISTHTIVMFMPVGAGLIIVHTVLHMVIDLDYLARGKTPPERIRSAH